MLRKDTTSDGELDYLFHPLREPTSCATVRSEQKFLTAPSKSEISSHQSGRRGGPKVLPQVAQDTQPRFWMTQELDCWDGFP
jgi:hypothetical protein